MSDFESGAFNRALPPLRAGSSLSVLLLTAFPSTLGQYRWNKSKSTGCDVPVAMPDDFFRMVICRLRQYRLRTPRQIGGKPLAMIKSVARTRDPLGVTLLVLLPGEQVSSLLSLLLPWDESLHEIPFL